MVIGSNSDGGQERFFVCYDGRPPRPPGPRPAPDWVSTGGGFYFSPAVSAVRALAAQAF